MWLVNLTSHGLNLTLRKIIYFTLRGENSQNVGQKLALTNKLHLRATNNVTNKILSL